MGNNIVYGQGHFISPNRVQKPQLKLDQKHFDIQKVFGRMDIPTTRAQKADDSIMDDLKLSNFTKIEHYQCIQRSERQEKGRIQVEEIKITRERKRSVLTENKNNFQLKLPQSHYTQDRRTKTEIFKSSHITEIENLQKYMTRNDSPVKQENIKPEQSQIRIFESRTQNKYFKLSK